MTAPIAVSDSTFPSEVLASDRPVLVDFWAPWCGPCQKIAPTVDAIAQEYQGRLKVAKVNVDDNQRLAAAFNVRTIPTLLFIRGGKEVDRLVGAVPVRLLKSRVDAVIAGRPAQKAGEAV